MNIYILRHGETTWNAGRKIQGQCDEGVLNENGILQAKQARKEILGVEFHAVYSSPLKRARQTAEIVTDGRNDILFDERLMERSYGDFEGAVYETLDDFYQEIWDIRVDDLSKYGNIETIPALFQRAADVICDLKKRHGKDENVLIVCHGGVVRALHFNLVGYQEDTKIGEFWTKNCQVRKYII